MPTDRTKPDKRSAPWAVTLVAGIFLTPVMIVPSVQADDSAGANSEYAGANDALSRAEFNFKIRDWDKAVFCLDEVIGLNDQNPKAYLLRGKAQFNLKQYPLAIQDFTRALYYAPHNFSAYMWRGSARVRTNEDELASRDYEQAIRLNSRLAKRYFGVDEAGKGGGQARFHIPGVAAEAAKSKAIDDYKAAMIKVYPKGYTAKPAGSDGEVPDAEDAEYLQEIAEAKPRWEGDTTPFATKDRIQDNQADSERPEHKKKKVEAKSDN